MTEVPQKKIASPKLIVCGYARSGKDTVCELLAKHGYTFASSSKIANELVVYPVLKEKYGYQTLEECFADRLNHRQEWFELIKDFNTPELSRLGMLILSEVDIYCGLRRKEELRSLQRYTNALTVWVDAGDRKPIESSLSCTVDPKMADIILSNNKDMKALERNVQSLFEVLQDERSVFTSNKSVVVEIDDGIVVRDRGFK